MTDKGFKTINEQLEILRSRGLTINDETQARDFLLHNNYYRISGYSLTLRKNDTFSRFATFQNIVDIYNFDHEQRRFHSWKLYAQHDDHPQSVRAWKPDI